VPPPAGYWPKIQAVLETYDVLLIADEVVTGFGRLGSMFGSAHYGLRPDLVTIAKGLSSAYAPISGTIVSDRMWEVLSAGTDELGPMGHGWTYSAHPICAAAAVANLELIDRLDLVANAGAVGAHLNAELARAVGDHPHVGEVRGEGLLAAVELVEDKAERRLFDPARKVGAAVVGAMLRRGVIARAMPEGDIVGLAPPLCLTRAEADRIVTVTREAVAEVLG
jgi:L-2,4-diaminobutyrate transaminase